jgi:putative flippase GtrA
VTKELLFASWPGTGEEHERWFMFFAGLAGCAVGMTANYLMSLKWVFTHRTVADRKKEFTVFMVIGVLGVVMQLSIYSTLNSFWVTYLEPQLPAWGLPDALVKFLDKRYYLLDKLVAIGFVFMFSFVTRRQLLFRRKHRLPAIAAEGCA